MNRPSILLRGLFVFVLLAGYIAGCATTGQPHMQMALDELRAARSELNVAMANKGGHRERAMGLVDQAISEVQLGMQFAGSH